MLNESNFGENLSHLQKNENWIILVNSTRGRWRLSGTLVPVMSSESTSRAIKSHPRSVKSRLAQNWLSSGAYILQGHGFQKIAYVKCFYLKVEQNHVIKADLVNGSMSFFKSMEGKCFDPEHSACKRLAKLDNKKYKKPCIV